MRFCPLIVLFLGTILFAQKTTPNPYATHAKFSVDSEDDPSSRQPELLHPRLSLTSAVATMVRSVDEPKMSDIEIVFYSFPFTERDVKAARSGDIAFLDQRWHATQSTNFKSPEYNGGAYALVRLSLDEHSQIQAVNISVPNYVILLDGPKLKNFAANYQFNGSKLTLKSKGAYRLDLKAANVPSFTMNWDIDLSTVVVPKAQTKGGR